MEIWKDIDGYEGLYQISNEGNVKSLNYSHTGKERLLKPASNRGGYLHVQLCKDGKVKHHTVHRLVAQAFIENPDALPRYTQVVAETNVTPTHTVISGDMRKKSKLSMFN